MIRWNEVTAVFVVVVRLLAAEQNVADEEPTVEFRGLFMATVYNIDWPVSCTDNSDKQKADLVQYLDLMQRINMNAIVFQVRPAGDALYNSTLEPWSKSLTCTQGKAPNPFWDPLTYLVDHAHRRNIEVHAWLNPYRANLSPNWNGLAKNHMANKYAQYAYPYSKSLWMDPGADVVGVQLIDVVKDIVKRYAVDGILFDDYFYPYPDGKPFPDNETYKDYVTFGGRLSRDDWRRENVNKMVVRVKDTIKLNRPGCKFGISPFGLYRPGRPEGMPSPIRGLDPYSTIYADSKLWLQRGWVDYLAPQLYWTIDSVGQSYPAVLDWWLAQNTDGKNIFVANGAYRMDKSDGDWPVSEITNQIEISRNSSRRKQRSMGNIMFSAKSFRQNTKNISDIFATSVYTKKAKIPGRCQKTFEASQTSIIGQSQGQSSTPLSP